MKWSGFLHLAEKRSLVAMLVMSAFTLSLNAHAGSRKPATNLDDIQLDDQPGSPAVSPTVSKPAAKPVATVAKKPKARPTRKNSVSLDDIQLDDAPTSAAGVIPLGAAPRVTEVEEVPDQIKLLLAVADIHEKDHDFKSVIDTLKPKLDQLPRSALLQLARAYAEEKDNLGEIHAIELVTAKNPKDYVAQTQLGAAYVKVKRYDDAATRFGAAKDVNPKYKPAYEGALSILEALQETYEARTLVIDIIKIFGPDAKYTASLCRMFSGEGFVPERSEDACRAAISKDVKNPENYVFLTMALTNTDQKAKADTTIADAAKRFPASEKVQVLAGSMKIDDKSFAESYRYYSNAVKSDPKSGRAWLGLAKSAFELQKHGEAIDDFLKACKLDRKTVLDFRQAATTLKRNKDPKWMTYQDAIDDRCD